MCVICEFVICPNEGPKMKVVVLHRVGILGSVFQALFCPKQGQGFKPSAAPLYPDMDKVPPGHRPVIR